MLMRAHAKQNKSMNSEFAFYVIVYYFFSLSLSLSVQNALNCGVDKDVWIVE